ncbi:tol-pal system-associated acyl-CoA thioesterase [Piscinibacter sp.]|uniref:tol-pal system-associated acyl-CoA thioesterase n=1 Tax=Piscinibacter sp. TaxID=1903157 RepID=UPI0039E2D30F
MAREDTPSTPFRHTLRVYWEDTDAGGVVFYANYLKFFERARTEWLRALGFSQQRLRTDTGAIFVVADTSVRFCRPARLDDLIEVSVEPRDIGRASMALHQQAWLGGGAPGGPALLAEGHIRIGCVDAGTFAPRRIPNAILDALT